MSLLAADRAAEERRTFVSVSWLDVKLGLRMLAKYPGLSIIAVLGMSLAIAIGAGYFAFIGAMLDSTLPIDEGGRVVVIQNRLVAGPDTGETTRASEHDFERVNGVLQAWNSERSAFRLMALAIIAGTLSVLLLSAAGIYAMMSFTVSRRRREIGIRSALGADARRVVTGIFGRAGAQIGAGIAAGLAIAATFEWLGPGGTMGDNALVILPSVVAVMLTVGLLAAIGPARRGLAVQPTEVLREE